VYSFLFTVETHNNNVGLIWQTNFVMLIHQSHGVDARVQSGHAPYLMWRVTALITPT